MLDIAPVALPNEPAEDRALLDPTARHALCANLQAELALVQEAFDLCSCGGLPCGPLPARSRRSGIATRNARSRPRRPRSRSAIEKHYRPLDSDFVSEFSAACHALAFGEADDGPFLALCRSTAGPADDPRTTRLQFIHLQRFIDADQQLRQGAREYVDRELPGLTHLPEPLRTALASVTLERASSSLLDRKDGFLQDLTPQEERVYQRLLCESLQRHPRNRRAHESLIDQLATRAEEDDSRGDAEGALIDAKLAFVGQFPDQYAHVRDLIDCFIAAGEKRHDAP